MAGISGAGSPLDLKLGQVPLIKDQAINYELQEVYNSLFILNDYMEILREKLESSDSKDASENLRFRRIFYSPAAQPLTAGAIVSIATGGGAVNGVWTTGPVSGIVDSGVTVGSSSTRAVFGCDRQPFYICLEDTPIGQLAKLGVMSGVLKVTGAVCGQVMWAAGAQSVRTFRDANTNNQVLVATPFTGNGSLYFNNPIGTYSVTGARYQWEGYWMPGYPNQGGGGYNYDRNFLYPVGIAILNDYVFFDGYLSVPSPPPVVFT